MLGQCLHNKTCYVFGQLLKTQREGRGGYGGSWACTHAYNPSAWETNARGFIAYTTLLFIYLV